MINLTGADLNQILTTYATMVGRSVLRSPTVAAVQPIFFKNETALTKTEAKQAYDALLAMNNIAMIPVGEKFIKAVSLTEAGQAGQRIGTNAAIEYPELGQYVSHVVQLKYVKPTEIMPAITPFARNAAGILPLDSSGIIVLRDYTENVKRMLEMIERMDVTYQSEFDSEVIPIKFAKAEDIASALNSLSSGGGSTTVGTRATTPGTGLNTGAGRSGLGQYGPGGTTTTPGGMTQPGAGAPSSTSSFSTRLDQIIRRAATTGGSGDFQIIGPNKIVADVRSNSLMIFASKQDMVTIKKIISELDVVLAQVLIETIILDVSLENAFNFGVTAGQRPYAINGNTNNVFGGVINNGNGPLAGVINFLNQVSGSNGQATANSAFTYPPGGGVNYFGKFGESMRWDVFVQAAASDGRINVIQTPQVQTSHATPASIFVGRTVPYVQSTYYGGGYAGGPSSSYQQLRVGIGLNVTPFINQDGLVVMKIDEQIDEISGSTDIQGVGAVPNTTSRTLSAEVAVRDRETIILGGFIRNSDQKTVSGVPILKDIPILGYLFTSRISQKERSELLVLMRPTVLRTPELAAAQVGEEKKRMTGVMQAEIDHEKAQKKAYKAFQEKNKDFDTVQPFTEEEKELYNRPSTEVPPQE